MSSFRTEKGGSQIDRGRTITFHFGGKAMQGFVGDTLASALIANGVSITGRSFKYHRPRGTVATGPAETNSLMQVGVGAQSTPNVPATLIPLADGLQANPVNCWPSVNFDIASINDRFAPLLSAGFYYKTFMWPSWHFFEGFVRKAAGLGKAPALPDPQFYDVQHSIVDKLIVGTCADTDVSIASGERAVVIGAEASDRIKNADYLPYTKAIAALDHGLILAAQYCEHDSVQQTVRQKLWLIRSKQIFLAADTQEQPLIFAHNDLPGVMLAGAVEEYIKKYGAAPGRNILIATGKQQGDMLEQVLRGAGLNISGRVNTDHGEQLRAAHGRRRVRAADVVRENGTIERLECDCIAMSGGFAPSVPLFLQAGGKLIRDEETGAIRASGESDYIKLVGSLEAKPGADILPEILTSKALAKASFVDFQTDVTVADVIQAVDENYSTPDHLKRYTVLGMGTDQGRLSGMNGADLLALISQQPPSQILPTKSRPPILPIAFATLGAGKPPGELMRPRKLLPAADFHKSHGAVFDDFGWERPSHYPINGEDLEQAAQRETKAVRHTAGLFDGSPLGKIELRGPEAARFLDHIYVGKISSLKIGKIRYGLMLNENGTIFDDGVVARCAEDHFLVNCTSGNADRVFSWLNEHHQCEWPYDLAMQEVTPDWATFAIAGPMAKRILADCDSDIDFDNDSFSHLTFRTGIIEGIPARVARVSFSGEASYEVSVHTSKATFFAETIWEKGRPHGLTLYGIEALEILRVEKGYIHIGADTDSETQPQDIGFGRMWSKKECDFLGRRSLLRSSSTSVKRKQLVGLKLKNPGVTLPMGAHVLSETGDSIGWVGSSYFSPNLGHGVALASIERGRSLIGEEVPIYSNKERWTATVTQPTFFDPDNERLK